MSYLEPGGQAAMTRGGTVTGELASWNDGTARRAVVEFAERTVSAGVPPEERVAVFDNDGTLWCEKPMPIQADFILRRLYEMAQDDPGLRGRQPWKAAYERDYGRRPLLAAGNSNGDIPMLEFTQHQDKPSLRLLVSMTTASASSTTPAAPSRPWSGPASAAGRSSA